MLHELGVEAEHEAVSGGIDLILGGHTHTLVQPRTEPTHGTVLCQAESNSKYIGRLEVRRQGTGFEITGEMLPVAARTEPVAAEIEEILATYRDSIEATMSVAVTGCMSCHIRPSRRVSVTVRPSSERVTVSTIWFWM